MDTSSHPPGTTRGKKWVGAAALLAPIIFLAAIPWLKEQPDGIVQLFAGIAATITVLCSFALAIIDDRRMDEWHRAASRFSTQWGWLAGGGTVALLLSLPPVQAIITKSSGVLAGVDNPDTKLVLMAFMLGFMAVVITQMLCTLALSAFWRSRMSRSE